MDKLNYLVEKNKNFPVGTSVRVTKTAEAREDGWRNCWVHEMDILVGEVGVVEDNTLGLLGVDVRFDKSDGLPYSFPYWVLEEVKPLEEAEDGPDGEDVKIAQEGGGILKEEAQYNLSDGKILIVSSEMIEGMAGEPMEAIYLTIDGVVVDFHFGKRLMEDADRVELDNFLEAVGDMNHNRVMNYIM